MIASVRDTDMLRFLTAGSVDDGKSTLIGRMLYEAGGVYEDQLASVQKASTETNGHADLSLITDGLKAEREQAITIDVAYRYFSTPRRKFVIADCPGHEQYTRNMATGASTADLAVLLVDARKGLLEQTRRHAYIAWLLRIRHFVVAINKMDLVAFDSAVFDSIRKDFNESLMFLSKAKVHFIPVSALDGDNVVARSDRMPWYKGLSLLHLLETISVEESASCEPLRLPVQGVIRPNQDFRGYSGQIASGSVRPGQDVIALPSMQSTTIAEVRLASKTLQEAYAPLSVVVSLTSHVDVSRGDMLVDSQRMPTISNHIVANLIWMSRTPLRVNSPYLIKHTTQTLCGRITCLRYRTDISTFGPGKADSLNLNEIGNVEIETHKPMYCDLYAMSRSTGSFIVIDPTDNSTVAAGMIVDTSVLEVKTNNREIPERSSNISGLPHQGLTVWFTGLSGAGKTTICRSVYTELLARGIRVDLLDGDEVRKNLNRDLGFSKEDRDENIRRIGFVAQLLARNGVVALVAAISPYRAVRDEVRRSVGSFLEVYVDAPLEVCEARDPKGLYKRARAKELRNFTGIDDPYEPPLMPELRCDTERNNLKTCTEMVVTRVITALVKELQ